MFCLKLVILHRFDCGSGAGILRSPEPVRLGHWNTISVYRHRWDAWLRLNNGKRVRGRSKVRISATVSCFATECITEDDENYLPDIDIYIDIYTPEQ